MPIYFDNQYSAVIAGIKEKVQVREITFGNTMSEKEILDFEMGNGVVLPEAYRRFLLEIGNGCKMFVGFQLLELQSDLKVPGLSKIFPFEKEYIEYIDGELTEEYWTNIGYGNIKLIDAGCGQSFHLIVCGPCKGEVWIFNEAGISPCWERQDFLGWFEKWLDDGDGVNYYYSE